MTQRRKVYFDTSIFIEMGTKRSKHLKNIRALLKDLDEDKARIYTSILTVQELSVASYRKGSVGRDTYGDVQSFARIWGIDKDIALTAAKREAELKDMVAADAAKRDSKKAETEDQRLERICENRRRKWDCFHLATAQLLGCPEMYTTDDTLQRRPSQLGITSLKVMSPEVRKRRIPGPITEAAGEIDV